MYVFVYGTILSGMRNNHRVDGSRIIGKGETVEKFYMSSLRSLSYPMVSYRPLHQSQKPTHIKGEIYEIDEETLQDLDYLEGHPHFYTRQFVDVKIKYSDINEEVVKAFCYIILQPDIINEVRVDYESRSEAVNDGDWRNYFEKNK